MKQLLALCLMMGAMLGSSAQTVVDADDARILYSGRINFSNPKSPLFVYPAVQISVDFHGTGIAMRAKPGCGYFMVTLDREEPFKVSFMGEDSVVTLATGLKEGNHSVKVMLATEGFELRPEFHGFVLEGNGYLLAKPAALSRRIEFIGNSITCGYGSEAASQHEHYSLENSNHYYSYAAILARELYAEEVCTARSGIGLYRNYKGKFPGQTMENWYDYTCIYDSTEVWDAARFRPDVICVNLGTNDLSTAGYDIEVYAESYRKFIRHLADLQPQAEIVILTSQMLFGNARQIQIDTLQQIYQQLKAEGLKVHFQVLRTQDPAKGYGADWHPSKAQNRQTADELWPLLQQLLYPN